MRSGMGAATEVCEGAGRERGPRGERSGYHAVVFLLACADPATWPASPTPVLADVDSDGQAGGEDTESGVDTVPGDDTSGTSSR